MGTEFTISIAALCTVLGAALSYAAFTRNKSHDEQEEGKSNGILLTEIGYIKANTDEIKLEQREQRKINTEYAMRLAAVEASTKQAHKRIDLIEGR